MKKALQIKHLRAERSVSDGAAVRSASERRFYGFRNRFAQVRVRDAGRDRGRLPRLLRPGLERGRRTRFGGRFRQWPRSEAKLRTARKSPRDLRRTLGQLEAPDRVPHVD